MELANCERIVVSFTENKATAQPAEFSSAFLACKYVVLTEFSDKNNHIKLSYT